METVVTMDMETIVLIASLISFTMTTALSIAILALCFAYCKVNIQRNQDCCSSKENVMLGQLNPGQIEEGLCHPSAVNQELQSEPHEALDAQHCSVNPAPLTTGNSLPSHFTNMRSASSFYNGLTNDSGYEDTLAVPRVQGIAIICQQNFHLQVQHHPAEMDVATIQEMILSPIA